MAASIDGMDVHESSEADDENDEEINVLSPNFNPLKALYASKVVLPVEGASFFNNLSEYESFMSKAKTGSAAEDGDGKERVPAARQRAPAPVPTSGAALAASMGDMSKRQFERIHRANMLEKEKQLPMTTGFNKKRRHFNVLSRMENLAGSPLDVLRQCVEKRCKIRVCVRSFKGLRSICIGFLVAFDKMWNMALMDVDEIYKKPSTGKRFHHEEKVTYSMIMAQLNPPQKKPAPARAKPQPSKPAAEKKECKFCRIIHEAILEQALAEEAQDVSSSFSGSFTGSSTGDSDSNGSSSTSSTEKSKDDMSESEKKIKCNKCMDDSPSEDPKKCIHNVKSSQERKTKSETVISKSGKAETKDRVQVQTKAAASSGQDSATHTCVANHKPSKSPDSQRKFAPVKEGMLTSAKQDSLSEKSAVQEKSANERKPKPSHNPGEASTILPHPSTDSASRSRRQSSQTTAKREDHSAPATSSKGTVKNAASLSTSSLSAAFAKSVTIQSQSGTLRSQRDSVDNKNEKRTPPQRTKEVVRLNPDTGHRLIEPEDFKHRHVNQLFIRGDNVVLVSVESGVLEVDRPKSDGKKKEQKK